MSVSRKDSFSIQVAQITDAFLIWLAFWLASEVRLPIREVLGSRGTDQDSLLQMAWALYIAVPFTPLVLERFGFYSRMHQKTNRSAAWQLIQGITIIGLVISMFAVFAQISGTRRLILALGALFIFILLFARAKMTSFWLARRRSKGIGREKVVLVGSDQETNAFLEGLDQDAISSWDIVHHFDLATLEVDALYEILKKEAVGRVVFSTKTIEFEKVARAIEVCELQGVEAWIAASFIRSQIARPVFDSLGSKPMLVLRSTPELSWELLCKEIIDRVGALIIILASSPLWVIAAVGIRIKSPGAPIFFSQMRAGRYGEPFRMWKFRTMVANAEELLEKVKESHGNQMDGPVFKLDHDPRIFPFGALLRKTSIDELPQLLNVVMGDMSLVGPRPLPLYEVEAFSDITHRRRLSVKPGITCEWQAGGRNKITNFEEWVEMDLRYIDNWSLWLDFQIILKTIPAVLFSRGAK